MFLIYLIFLFTGDCRDLKNTGSINIYYLFYTYIDFKICTTYISQVLYSSNMLPTFTLIDFP
jgi:hypothetical protein